MRKLSKIDESVWGDLRKRSSGEVIRREDLFHTCLGIDMNVDDNGYDFRLQWTSEQRDKKQ